MTMQTKKIIDHIRDAVYTRKSNLPFTVIAIALFGSYAIDKQNIHSDIDLLVVAEGIHPQLHRRASQIVLLKNMLSIGIPSDILLLTKDECISNFTNHNPLFLDIACDGIIIVDQDSFLSSLIDETNMYITNNKLQKLDDGWRFPVQYRRTTFLSSVSNKDFAHAMLADGKRNVEIGCKLIDDKYFDKAIYHFQQSVEKAIKAILILLGEFKKSHFAAETLKAVAQRTEIDGNWKDKLIQIAEISKEIEPQVTWSRYPGIVNNTLWIPDEQYTNNDAIEMRDKSKIAIAVADDFVTWWFID
jgi:HEPN domain-containing protein/predicted nucleotidyltransferase